MSLNYQLIGNKMLVQMFKSKSKRSLVVGNIFPSALFIASRSHTVQAHGNKHLKSKQMLHNLRF